MCYRLFTPDGAHIRRVSNIPFPKHYLKENGGEYPHDEVVGVTKSKFHKDNTSPIKQKVKDDGSILRVYRDEDGDWKKIVKKPDYEFSYNVGVVGCAIREQSENKIEATSAELKDTK